jgi:hypothetical protein
VPKRQTLIEPQPSSAAQRIDHRFDERVGGARRLEPGERQAARIE